MNHVRPYMLINVGVMFFLVVLNSVQVWLPPTVSTLAYWGVAPLLLLTATHAVLRRMPPDWGEQSRAGLVLAALWFGGFPTERFFNNARVLAILVVVDLGLAVIRQGYLATRDEAPLSRPPESPVSP